MKFVRTHRESADRPSFLDNRTGPEGFVLLKQTPMWTGRAILLFAILLAPSVGLGDDGVRSGATAYGD